MKHTQFYFLCGVYIALTSVGLIYCARKGPTPSGPAGRSLAPVEEVNCAKETYKQHSEEFLMKMGLCRKNISVVCATKPSHPCLKNQTLFKATAVMKGYTGQCLIEAELSKKRTLRFYIEAKRVRNPNEDGSRSLGGEGKKEEHQRGKCLLKYVCHQRVLRSINMDCGTVIVNEKGRLSNFTRRRQYWAAPPKYKDLVFFSTGIKLASNKLALDVATTKIFIPGIEQKDKQIDEDVDEEEAAQEYTPIRTIRNRNNKDVKKKPIQKDLDSDEE
ncbi:unnamed protein product [Orchesella dallaii]|uniref:Uncharacterized protein n=1 Tax=Orchesella dallaii TaxID=48710 RepID=A0ABP1RDZ2_9HEXA